MIRTIKDNITGRFSLSSKLFVKESLASLWRFISNSLAVPTNFVVRVLNRLGIKVTWAARFELRTPVIKRTSLEIDAAELPSRTTSGAIQTSIIVPVFNKVAFTLQCLRSALREINVDETEIVVVDNASTDETPQVLSRFGDLLRVIRNEENRGFVDACNQGAAAARGKYLMFLNNDTEVQPGWLTALVDTIESDAQVGAVGSMFLYPDEKIQEAGAIVWNDGQAHRYGWSGSPTDRRFNYAREVDYCSAASLLIRKELFDRLGGFDRRFAPAYYEDVDLCFGVRSLGHKVIYQPASRVIHYEGATAGRDVTKSWKRYQVLNREKFHQKWREVLQRDHFAPNSVPPERAANRKAGPKVLVFDDHVPAPDRDAGSARMQIILKHLARKGQCTFISIGKLPQPESERELRGAGVEIAPLIGYKRLLKTRRFDVALMSRPDVADALLSSIKRTAPGVKTIFDTVDLVFVRLEREYRLTGDHKIAQAAERYKRIEARLARSCDQVWCVTEEDRVTLSRGAPEAHFAIIPTIHPLQDRGRPFAERNGLVFIGNYLHRPNVDAVHYFMRQIYPAVREAVPIIKLNIVGDNAPPEFAAYAASDVNITGHVANVDPIFQSSRIFVAPLRFGSGIKGKIGQALSYGLPVVTTSIGAEGMRLTQEREAIIADDAREFANSVIKLYTNAEVWQMLSDNGYRHIARHFTPEVVEEEISEAIKTVCALKKP